MADRASPTRIVPMDRHLLGRLVESERDPLTAEMSSGTHYADRVMVAASHGLAFAMLDGGEVPVGGGLMMLWPGRAEGWWLVSREARPRHLALAARASARLLDRRQRDPAFRRIECFVRSGERWSTRFAEAMGFRQEGFHRAWDPAGRDYRCFARVRL